MTPGERIREEMEARGWTQRDLALVLDRSLPAINEIIQGKRVVSPEMAVALQGAFGIEATEWLRMDATFRLAQIDSDVSEVASRAKLYEIAPIKDMEKRGWISKTQTAEDLRAELLRFYQVDSLDSPPEISASFKKTAANDPVNASQRAWCFRAKHLAQSVAAASYDEAGFQKGIKKLRRLTGWPEETRKVSRILADMGIRFVVVEPLPRTKIDGATFWLDPVSPVVAMTIRFDRIDSFWHVLGHELSHVKHRDDSVIDSEIVGEGISPREELSPVEQRANTESASMWLEAAEMDYFIRRVAPLYSKAKINQFANRLVVHPGVIVGQLHGRGEIGYQALRDSLVKVRDFVTSEAMTDGWGHIIGR